MVDCGLIGCVPRFLSSSFGPKALLQKPRRRIRRGSLTNWIVVCPQAGAPANERSRLLQGSQISGEILHLRWRQVLHGAVLRRGRDLLLDVIGAFALDCGRLHCRLAFSILAVARSALGLVRFLARSRVLSTRDGAEQTERREQG